jgi:hypothetical protein
MSSFLLFNFFFICKNLKSNFDHFLKRPKTLITWINSRKYIFAPPSLLLCPSNFQKYHVEVVELKKSSCKTRTLFLRSRTRAPQQIN